MFGIFYLRRREQLSTPTPADCANPLCPRASYRRDGIGGWIVCRASVGRVWHQSRSRQPVERAAHSDFEVENALRAKRHTPQVGVCPRIAELANVKCQASALVQVIGFTNCVRMRAGGIRR